MININIKDIINEWDPINLFPYAPIDEYEEEIALIEVFIKKNKAKIDSMILAKEILKIFIQRFGDDIFIQNIENCKLIATKILYHT